MHFFHSIWKNLHLTENFYTGNACGACDKYEVYVWTVTSLLDLQVIVGDFWQQNSGQRIISPSVGKVALAIVATIEHLQRLQMHFSRAWHSSLHGNITASDE